MDMGRRLVHMQVGGEYIQVGVPCLEAPEVFVQHGLGLRTGLCFRAGILPVADLQDQLMEGLLLLAGTDLIIVIVDPPIGAGLPGIVPFQGFIEQFVIDLPDRFVAIIHVEVGTIPIHILRLELAAVVVDGALAHHGADGSFHFKSPSSLRCVSSGAFVTFCESNAKALLTAGVQKCNLQAGFAFCEADAVAAATSAEETELRFPFLRRGQPRSGCPVLKSRTAAFENGSMRVKNTMGLVISRVFGYTAYRSSGSGCSPPAATGDTGAVVFISASRFSSRSIRSLWSRSSTSFTRRSSDPTISRSVR